MDHIIFIILGILACSSVFWIRILNDIEGRRDHKHFRLTWENFRYISTGKSFVEWYSLVCLLGILWNLYHYIFLEEDTGSDIVMIALMLLLFQVPSFIVDVCKCRALPMKNVLNRATMKKSIESEEFTRIGPHCWESEHWVKITYQFYPKALLLGAMVYYRHTKAAGRSAPVWEAYLKTIDGQEYINKDYRGQKAKLVDYLKYEITDDGGIEKINAKLPLASLTQDPKYFDKNWLSKYQDNAHLSQYITAENTAQLICNYEYGKLAAQSYMDMVEEIEEEEMTHHYKPRKK